jgi:hypothetical protein
VAVIVPQPPAKGDARFDQWVYLLWKSLRGIPGDIPEQFNPIAGANVTLTGTYPDITFAASGGGGGTTNNYITQSLTAQRTANRSISWQQTKTFVSVRWPSPPR